jgi:hypothetical protein
MAAQVSQAALAGNEPSFIFSPTILRSSDAKIHSGQGFLGMRGPGLHLVPGQEVLARVTV